tara:strand:+ start:1302 stop:2645 length:1344 start_codon:yes stop_codon:yes gene_type:complete
MISKNIILQMNNSNIQFNSNMNETDQLYFNIENQNITNYININYTISFNKTLNDEIFYFIISENHKLQKKTITNNNISYTYFYGINDLNFDSNTLKLTKKNNLNETNKKYTYYIYKLTKTTNTNYNINTFVTSGSYTIGYELVYIKLNINNKKVNLDLTDTTTKINKDCLKLINENDELKYILLQKNTNYLFYIDNFFSKIQIYNEIYEDYDLKSIFHTNINSTFIEINETKKYKWSIVNNTLNLKGDLINYDIIDNVANDEILEDNIFQNINILNKIYYNHFDYNEFINIFKINNNTNHLEKTYSNKLLLVDKIQLKRLEIILPSNNIRLGIVYKILFLHDLISINIKCEDNTDNIENYDVFKGLINIININNNTKKIKSIIPDFYIVNNKKTIDLNNNIILKNSGTNKYGYIELYCINKINNKYIWNIRSDLLNNNNLNINSIFI